jgi:predicted ATPase
MWEAFRREPARGEEVVRRHAAEETHDGSGPHLAELVPLRRATVTEPIPAPGHSLPAYASSFVNRVREMAEVADLLRHGRLVTLTGSAGIGKTRLSVEVARRVAPGTSFFVDLAPVGDAALVDKEVASAFAVSELQGRDLADVLASELTGDALLVLDNCEHVFAACADLVHRLLQGCRLLRILATSRRRLGVPGEVVWLVPPLALPEMSTGLAPEAALGFPAARLFCERAEAVNRNFFPSTSNLEGIVEICRRLDGNPLALELAAARVDALSPADIAACLEDHFGILRGVAGAGPARHQTLAAALQWSDQLLDEPERVLLRRLSVFVGGFCLSAAQHVRGW